MIKILFITFSLGISGCGLLGGGQLKSTTTLKSSTLASTRIVSRTKSNSLQLNAALVSSNCSIAGAVACITPTEVSGMAYYAGLMVGSKTGYSLGPILGTSNDPSKITTFKLSDLSAFNMAEGIKNSGSPTCCGGTPYPSDSEATLRNVSMYFGYIDVTFELTAEDGAAGSMISKHSIRTVYGNIAEKSYQKGDLLYKGPNDSDFSWCDLTQCGLTTRPTAPLQESSIANFTNTDLGNKVIPTFTANLVDGHEVVTLTQKAITDSTKTWAYEIDFLMTNGVYFKSAISALTTTPLLVAGTRIAASYGNDSGFKARVKATATTSTSSSTSTSTSTATGT